MASANIRMPALVGGELSPTLWGRTDIDRYRISVARMVNFVPVATGGAEKRPGTEFCTDALHVSTPSSLHPFIFNEDQSYVLEMGNFLNVHGTSVKACRVIARDFSSNTSGVVIGPPIVILNSDKKFPCRIITDTGLKYTDEWPEPGGYMIVTNTIINESIYEGLVSQVFPYATNNEAGAQITELQSAEWLKGSGIFDVKVTAPGHGLSNGDWVILMGPMTGKTTTDFDSLFTTLGPGPNYTPVGFPNTKPKWHRIQVIDEDSFYLNYDMGAAYLDTFSAPATGLSVPYGSLSTSTWDDWYMWDIDTTGSGTAFNNTPPLPGDYCQVRTYAMFDIPWPSSVAAEIDYDQNGDIMTVVHKDYRPREIRRWDHHRWSVEEIWVRRSPPPAIKNIVLAPRTGSVDTGTASTEQVSLDYAITGIDEETGEESKPFYHRYTAADPMDLGGTNSWSQAWTLEFDRLDGYESYNIYKLNTYGGDWYGFIGNVPQCDEEATTGQLAYDATHNYSTMFGWDRKSDITVVIWDNPTTVKSTHPYSSGDFTASDAGQDSGTIVIDPGSITYDATDLVEVKVKAKCIFRDAAVGTGGSPDSCILPTYGDSPPPDVPRNPFGVNDGSGENPRSCAIFQQRRFFASSENAPQTIWSSQSAAFDNFDVSRPSVASDAITAVIAAGKINPILHIVAMRKLIVLTSGAEWYVEGDDSGALLPSAFVPKPQTYNGANRIKPVVIGNSLLFIEATGNRVRDLAYEFSSDSYEGNDLTVMARHLFDDRTISDWAYASQPDSIVWSVMSDGTLTSLTYMREHQVWAWAQHETFTNTHRSRFTSVCSVPEGDETAVYFSIRRFIGGEKQDLTGSTGAQAQFIERLATKKIGRFDSHYVDCGVHYESSEANGNAGRIMQVREYSGYPDTIYFQTLTGQDIFASGDEVYIETLEWLGCPEVGGYWTVERLGSLQYRLHPIGTELGPTIASNHATALRTEDVSKYLGFGTYTALNSGRHIARKLFSGTLGGFDHLVGEPVAVIGDGSRLDDQVVDGNGEIQISSPCWSVYAGIPYDSEIETLPIIDSEGQLAGRVFSIGSVTIEGYQSRSFEVKPVDSEDDEYATFAQRDTGYATLSKEVGVETITLPPEWGKRGRLIVRSSDPVPCSILSITPKVVTDDE